ncbi:class I SAM-dependent methyltransferase [Chelatococcus daeguensis]|uniref:Methyltransferase domain n=1 Tax=Chelatococcus sambhunathii TaxID=363953 RepID=A0ABM9U7J4_9HYPH|nr:MULTISPECIES: class I SAM-dependent methyltransferase [Chelatococcus]KZE36302.1 SAM-dependent methyltransferase [Chelatococcus daeguensis]MBM3084219.1 class I SAM-dependent methyltransferase [Chelatococcus daeguensis]CUA89552.1 Methyltransferase domain [Chelatococcus sambhunathii]
MAAADIRGPDTASMRKAYARWAPVYDVVYDKLTAPARERAVAAALACGTHILEVGVGTGLSLEAYPTSARVTGVDLSEHMLRRAQQKVDRLGLRQVEALAVMDACRLGFPDGTFDAVVSQFVITLVPDPEAALDEFARVLRPGGEIVLANHFGAAGGALASLEEAVAPLASKVGWSSAFKAERIARWARSRGVAEVVSLESVFPGGFFKVMQLRKFA